MAKSSNSPSKDSFFGRLFKTKTISTRLIVPIPLAVLVAVAAIWFVVPKLVAENAREEAVRSSQQIAGQFKIIRGYYTKNVISKIVKSKDLKPSYNHKSEPKSVPLPATFIHDLSALLSKQDTNINLYSKYPFPIRKDRKLDDFQTAAWTFLSANPDKVFSRQVTRNGKEVVRVAVADKMVAKGCVNCHNSHATSPKTDWKLGDVRGVLEVSTVIESQLAAGATLSRQMVFGALFIGILLTLVAVMATRGVTGPLARMAVVMKKLAGGNQEVDIPDMDRKDEIGAMAEAVQVFKNQGIEREALAEAQSKEQHASQRRAEHVEGLAQKFDSEVTHVLDNISQASERMKASAEKMNSVADATNSRANDMGVMSETANSKVQAVAGAAEELSASISEISRQVSQSSTFAQDAVEAAARTNEQVAGLSDAAQSVGDVVSLINDIADQTNLLALNATIEAARAGELGKGFAVVASEVKTLASQTAKATEEISSHITSIQGATTGAVTSISEISETINQINQYTGGIASAVEEQGAATQEIARNIEETAVATQEVNQNLDGVKQAATETENSADMVLSTSQSLIGEIETLRHQVSAFLNDVKAA